ncbi:urea carboxylase [Zalerion maritima]|uniref:Urea carboxylase n=1 Tax=Zalerion maritima TaxID=339359 RepID=A0AAD5WRL3_9PEZI|nr:urea carboxylase [Zalerion maritima]
MAPRPSTLAKGSAVSNAGTRSLHKPNPNDAAIEVRTYAEDPYHSFAPSPGVFQEVRWPQEDSVRMDIPAQSGQDVSLHYEIWRIPSLLLSKVMVHEPTTEQVICTLPQGIALRCLATNLDFARAVVHLLCLCESRHSAKIPPYQLSYQACGVYVINPGAYSTIQGFPGRPAIGYGIPKSCPVDHGKAAEAITAEKHPALNLALAAVESTDVVVVARIRLLLDGSQKLQGQSNLILPFMASYGVELSRLPAQVVFNKGNTRLSI